MQLFSRTGVLAGDPNAAAAWAVDIANYVTEKCGRQVSVWTAQFGAPIGTTSWSTFVEGMADFQNTFGGLLGDAGYAARGMAGAPFETGPHTSVLREVLVGGPNSDGPPPLGSLALITTAVCNAARIGEAVAWGAELAGYLTSIGSPTSFLLDQQGPFGQVTWIGVTASAADYDALGAKVNADAGYLQRLGGLSDLFVPSSGQRQVMTRIG